MSIAYNKFQCLEILHHFNCKDCKGWWSIANETVMKRQRWFCPWCGVEQYYDEGNIPLGGEVSPEKDN